jgi:hypothetical protein
VKTVFIGILTTLLVLNVPVIMAEENVEPEASSEIVLETDPTYAPGMSPGEHGGWVAVGPDGTPIGGVIVCTPEVCGQSGPGSFLELMYGEDTEIVFVLQTLQDPVEAANSENGVGNVAGHSGAVYDFINNRWTIGGPNGSIYQIPLAYPGEDRGGNGNWPFCIEGCHVLEQESGAVAESNEEVDLVENNSEDSISLTQRTIAVKPELIKNSLVVSMKIKGQVFKNTATIIAIKGNKKMVWNKRIKNGALNLKIPKKYSSWKISVRYRIF